MIASLVWRALDIEPIAMQGPTVSRNAAAMLIAVLAAGCSSWQSGNGSFLGLVSPHRIDIQQGNVVTQEQLARVKLGMNRLQVRDALGSPLLADSFHPDRWDYVFTLRQDGRPVQRRNVVLVFEGDSLKSVEAPDLPTDLEFINSISRGGRVVAAAQLELTAEQLKALPIPPRVPSPPPADGIPNPIPSTRTFPPLEPL